MLKQSQCTGGTTLPFAWREWEKIQ